MNEFYKNSREALDGIKEVFPGAKILYIRDKRDPNNVVIHIHKETIEMGSKDLVEVRYSERKRETEKAILVTINGAEHWLPKSQISSEPADGIVIIPKWLVEAKEIPNDAIIQGD